MKRPKFARALVTFLCVVTVVSFFGCSRTTGPAGATALCRDGTYSYSEHRQGTCSHHGGVAEWGPFAAPSSAATVEIASAPTPAPTPAPAFSPTASPTPTPSATPTPALKVTPTPAELYFADVAEYPEWEKDFDGRDYVYFNKSSERDPVYSDRVRMWVMTVVKGPPERIRREMSDDVRSQGLSTEGYERFTKTLTYISFDCRNKSYRRLTGTDYDEDGNQLYSNREEYSYTYAAPDTIGAKLLEVACKSEAPQAAESEASPPYVSPSPAQRARVTTPLETGPPSAPAYPSPSYTPPVAENGSYYGEISPRTGRPKTVHVEGYTRRDGTYVRGHYRSAPRR
ncbi:MAG: surface-adhesin E family protein [Pyrinomonadaceae bacterium]